MNSQFLKDIPDKENLPPSVLNTLENLFQENDKLKKDKKQRLQLFDQLDDMLKSTRTELENYKSKYEYSQQQVTNEEKQEIQPI